LPPISVPFLLQCRITEYILKEHGDRLHPSLCHPTNLCYCFRVRHRNIPSNFKKFPECSSNFPEFSRIKKSL